MAASSQGTRPRRVILACCYLLVWILGVSNHHHHVSGREDENDNQVEDSRRRARKLEDEMMRGGDVGGEVRGSDENEEGAGGSDDEGSDSSDDTDDDDEEEEEKEEALEKCADDGTCASEIRGYDLLLDDPEGEPWHKERPETCDDNQFWTLEWRSLQVLKSKYQHVEFCQDPRNDDTCLDLDNIIQICASYRPHYHEMMVHYPARYLPAGLRRVAFIGGGDSLLLHEILKYPELELVMGLELDQQVTRGSYKYFGSQPHWDDPRVEWWYGDATKSLMVLPQAYYGSFDLVLVDLSETVMALSVTDELDVMQSLALLLQPQGVFVQNEVMHFFDISRLFQYTMHSHLYDVPIVCSQSIIIGSHTVDLLRHPVTKHKVPYLMSRVLDDDDWMTQLVHDFQRNASNVPLGDGTCRPAGTKEGAREGGDAAAGPPSPAPVVAGVLMVADAEQLSDEALHTSESILNAVIDAAKSLAFTLVSSAVASDVHTPSESSANRTVHRAAVILKEGYVLTHCVSTLRYCSVDIHLWLHVDRQARLRSSIVSALALRPHTTEDVKVSSFRVVTGGMSGTPGFEEDARNRGLLSVPACNGDGSTAGSAHGRDPRHEPDASLFRSPPYAQVLQRAKDLLPQNGAKGAKLVAVLCGHAAADADADATACESVAALKEAGGDAYRVLELRACAELTDGIEYSQHATLHYQHCEAELVKAVTAFLQEEGGRLDAIVVDPTAPFTLGQVVLHLFQSKGKRSRMMAEHRLVVAPVLKPWHGVLVDRFRTQVFVDEPLFRAEVQFKDGADDTYRVAYCSSGDDLFVRRLTRTLSDLEQALPGTTADVHLLRGPWGYKYLPSEPVAEFTHLDYDQVPGYEQWRAQTEVLRQAVAQFALSSSSGASSSTTAKLGPTSIRSAMEGAMTEALGRDSASKASWMTEGSSIGAGAVVVAMADAWTAAVVWDGASTVTANILTYDDQDDAFGVELILTMKETFDLETALFDQHPRGTGSVVNWREDTEGVFPIWAEALKESAQVSSLGTDARSRAGSESAGVLAFVAGVNPGSIDHQS